MLPVTVLGVGLLAAFATTIDGPPSAVALLALPLYVGFLGTQRIWYARAWEGRGVTPGEAARLTWGMLWEYAALGMLMFLAGMFAATPVYLVAGRTAAVVAHLLFVDVLFTFASSAVALDDKTAGEALSVSWRLLRSGFPRNLPHAVLAPMALYALADRQGWAVLAAEAVAFVARGVTTSYYLRSTALPEVPAELVVDRNPVYFH
jgi:hypothetical protein